MKVPEVTFLMGAPSKEHFPKTKWPEYAFIGRSNVGKSSMINFLTGQKKLARTSSTPGRTREINFFLVENSWLIADLPGYGYAKINKTERARIKGLIADYLNFREEFHCLFVLIDSRIPPQKNDLELLRDLGQKKIPFAIVFTKADKPASKEIKMNLETFEKKLLEDWEEIPRSFITSTKKKIGKKEILDYINDINGSTF